MVTYASFCWGHVLRGKGICKELQKLDRLGLLNIAQVAPSSPTKGLAVIHDVMPLEIFVKFCAVKTLSRLSGSFHSNWDNGNDASRKGHIKFWRDLAEAWELTSEDTDRTTVCVGARLFRVVTDSFSGESKFLTPAQFNIFTDGSKTSNGIGSGIAI